jgi:hypothetical protein
MLQVESAESRSAGSEVVLFRPLGLYRLFRTPVSLLAERGTEGHSVFGQRMSALYQQLGDTPSLRGRKEILDAFFLRQLMDCPALDPRARALQWLISSPGSASGPGRSAAGGSQPAAVRAPVGGLCRRFTEDADASGAVRTGDPAESAIWLELDEDGARV